MTALRRVQKELRDITATPLEDVTIEPLENNLFNWDCSIKAASDSPYRGGVFHFKLEIPDNYPFKAPNVTFTTKIYHPGTPPGDPSASFRYHAPEFEVGVPMDGIQKCQADITLNEFPWARS